MLARNEVNKHMRWGICQQFFDRVCPPDFDFYRQGSNTINVLLCPMLSSDVKVMKDVKMWKCRYENLAIHSYSHKK